MTVHFQAGARRLVTAAAFVALAATAAQAQSVAAFVNGDPITTFDVEQRIKINLISGKRGGGRQEALRELVDDKLKVAEARRIGYRLNDDNVDDQMARIARANNQTAVDFVQSLSRAGIDSNAYRAKLRADYSWELAVGRKSQGAGGNDPEVEKIYQAKLKEGAGKITDFVVHSIIFVVPRDTNPATREREANAARARFNDCTTGLEAMRQLRDVAVKPPVKRSSDQLSPQLAGLLAKTPLNRTTQAFRSEQGVELIAVCEKTERVDTSVVRARAEAEVAQKRRNTQADDYLKELRSKAVIQYR